VGKVYCANDRVDAVKIARIYLSELPAVVRQQDQKTLERQEVSLAGDARPIGQEAAASQQSIVEVGDLAVAARRGSNKVAVAVAQKLAAAVRHVLQGHGIVDVGAGSCLNCRQCLIICKNSDVQQTGWQRAKQQFMKPCDSSSDHSVNGVQPD
jgi:ferredoxin-like protein FixX